MNAKLLADRLLDFAARVGKVVDALPKRRLANHAANQLVRCGRAPGSHYEEACGAESRSDFIHKLWLALKELRESSYWLRLIERSQLLSQTKLARIIDGCEQLSGIIGKSIATATQNLKRR